MNEQTVSTIREALEYVKVNQESFWKTWAADKERPSELLLRIDAAIADLQQGEGVSWEPNAEGLLPCPFCGAFPQLVRLGTGDSFSYSYHCPNSLCMATNGKFFDQDEAIAAWNKRTTTPQPAS